MSCTSGTIVDFHLLNSPPFGSIALAPSGDASLTVAALGHTSMTNIAHFPEIRSHLGAVKNEDAAATVAPRGLQ